LGPVSKKAPTEKEGVRIRLFPLEIVGRSMDIGEQAGESWNLKYKQLYQVI